MNNKKRILLILSALFLAIGNLGPFVKASGIYPVFIALGIVFLILGFTQKDK